MDQFAQYYGIIYWNQMHFTLGVLNISQIVSIVYVKLKWQNNPMSFQQICNMKDWKKDMYNG
jgi:hypothetical protein